MVFFDWDGTRLSPASLNVLEQARDAFKTRQGARVTANALVKLGVPAAAITTVGRGEAGLLVQTGDGVREPQNRRVEITIPQRRSPTAMPATMPVAFRCSRSC
jgi:OOP family OmpA-OmpF porin